jgi:hypothetical protein
MAEHKERLSLPVEVRLDHGNLSIEEVCALVPRSKTGFYEDLKAGLVAVRKIVVPGPIARAYTNPR